MTEVIIEKAAPDDARAIMTLKRNAWLAAYTSEELGVDQAELLKKFGDLDEAVTGWESGIATETIDGPKCTFIARLGGKVVGYTSPETDNNQKRLGAMYVDPSYHGHGIGGKLLQKAVEWHGPDEEIFLHVVSYNDKAIGFYEHSGFERTGVEFPEEYDEKLQIRYLPESEMVLRS